MLKAKRTLSGFLCWIQSHQLRKKTKTPTTFYLIFNFSRFEARPVVMIHPRESLRGEPKLSVQALQWAWLTRDISCQPGNTAAQWLLNGDSAPSLGTATTLTKTASFSKKLSSVQLGALGGEPQPPQMGKGKETLYLTLLVEVDLPNGGVQRDHTLRGCQLCMAQV